MKLIAITVIDNGREKILPGESFSLPGAESKALIAAGAACPAGRTGSPAPAPETVTQGKAPAADNPAADNPETGQQRDPLTGLPTE